MRLEDLFRDHHAALFRFISRMTGDPDFAMDIVQETFVKVASRPLPTDVSPRACLFQVARGLARSGLRKRNRRMKLLNGGRAAPEAAPAPRPDDEVERADARQAVREALAQLREKERTVLLMHEEGFSHREIAEAVGTTTGSVGTMFARALVKLEERLGEAWRDES